MGNGKTLQKAAPILTKDSGAPFIAEGKEGQTSAKGANSYGGGGELEGGGRRGGAQEACLVGS